MNILGLHFSKQIPHMGTTCQISLSFHFRNLPPGICSSFDPPEADGVEVKGGNRQGSEENGQQNGDFDMSASIFRHTYNQNLSQFGTQFQGPPVRNFPKLNSTKTTRNIRLRPRQTLCSKCKSSCLDSEKGPVPVSQLIRTQNTQKTVNFQQDDISKTNGKNELKKKRKDESDLSEQPMPTKLIKLERVDRTASLTKTSPFIKISIGEGTVMNIPPRIHEDKETEELSSEEKVTDDENACITTVVSNDDDSKDNENNSDISQTSYKKHKKSMKKSKERDKNTTIASESMKDDTFGHKKHKKKHKHRHSPVDDHEATLIITENIDMDEDDEKNENSEPQIEVVCQRPRLLYTWRQNKGLSPRHDGHSNIREDGFHVLKAFSPQRENYSGSGDSNIEITSITNDETDVRSVIPNRNRKEYRLRSRSKSLDSNPSYEITSDSAYVSYEDPKSISDRSEGCSTESDSSSDTDSSDYGDGPPGDENVEAFRPLMMKIQTNSVSKCVTSDGRKISIGDIVWGKIQGFPWWPGRVLSIAVSKRDNDIVFRQLAHVSWFGSSTMSNIQCSDLYPFLEDFKLRYKRKKRGPYKVAIKQATIAAQSSSNTHDIDFNEYDL